MSTSYASCFPYLLRRFLHKGGVVLSCAGPDVLQSGEIDEELKKGGPPLCSFALRIVAQIHPFAEFDVAESAPRICFCCLHVRGDLGCLCCGRPRDDGSGRAANSVSRYQ